MAAELSKQQLLWL